MPQPVWDDASQMLDAYIYDYLLKRKLYVSARSFLAERKVSMDPVVFDAPGGFLFEWWSVFWDIFISRINPQHSEAADSYIKSQVMKAGDLQLQQQYYLQNPTTSNRLVMSNSLNIQNPSVANRLAAKMYEENSLANVLPQKRFFNHVSQNSASIFDAQPLSQSQTLWNNSDTQNKIQRLPGSRNWNSQMNSVLNSRAGTTEGIAGSNQGTGHMNLKGWPSTVLDPLSFGHLQEPESFVQLPRTSNQFQLQHPPMNQTTQSLGVPSANVTCLRSRVPLSENMNAGKDKQSCFIDMSDDDKLVPVNQHQTCHPVLPYVNADMLLKLQEQQPKIDNQKAQQFLENPASSQHSQNSNHSIPRQDKLTSSGITSADDYMSNNFQANNQADVDCLMDGGVLDDVESFLSPNKSDEIDEVGSFSDAIEESKLKEICLIPASTNEVECCCFSSDGKLLASGGRDKKAILWCTKSFTVRSTLDEHSQRITDVRFSPRTLKIATSSGDRTVKVWDVDNQGQSLWTFTGHSTGVTSLDFHPSKEDLICSSDISSEIRYWSMKNGRCVGIFKGGATKLRFQPNDGRVLAAAVGNVVSIIDIETQVCRLKLQGHKSQIHSLCWDPSGEYLASTSDDVAKVWKFCSGSKGDCIHELNCNGDSFHSCVFHPTNTSLLIIGSHKSLELWDMGENKTRTLLAHDKLVSALAASNVTGLVASGSHDNCVKVWQ